METVYQITPEQRDYYLTQFRAVQPDQNGLLSGPIARMFFEKSRIPIEELRHIWQLCDVTRDGALSLGEFTAAMHLVVLRRNNIPLPQILPSCLMPTTIHGPLPNVPAVTSGGPPEADLLHLDDDQDNGSCTQLPLQTTNETNDYKRMISVQSDQQSQQVAPTIGANKINSSNNSHHHSQNQLQSSGSPVISIMSQKNIKTRSHSNTPPMVATAAGSSSLSSSQTDQASPPRISKYAVDWINQSKEWTKFTESPTSNVSSPGPKPVNFDMQRTAQAVVSDPLILHPVPVRVTPIGIEILDEDLVRLARKSDAAALAFDNATAAAAAVIMRDSEASPKQLNTTYNTSSQQRDSLQNELRAIQRPQPKKVPSKNVGAIPPPPQREPSVNSDNLDNSITTTYAPQPLLSSKKDIGKEAPPLPPPRYFKLLIYFYFIEPVSSIFLIGMPHLPQWL